MLVLTIERRHNPACIRRHGRRPPADYRRCTCTIYVKGVPPQGGKPIFKALNTRDWAEAERALEGRNARPWGDKAKLLSEAIEQFVTDKERQRLDEATLRKYRLTARVLADSFPLAAVEEITPDKLRQVLTSLRVGASTQRRYIQQLRSFFTWCVAEGFIRKSPAAAVTMPKVRDTPTLPLTADEFAKVLAACHGPWPLLAKGGKRPSASGGTRATLPGESEMYRAFLLVQRYSGLRIGDVATLEKLRVQNGKLLRYTEKTNTPVYIPLPKFVLDALERFPHASPRYFFWDGATPSVTVQWIDRLRVYVFRRCGVPDMHSHRLRDTFACELLLAGVPLDVVSKMLGHASVKVTEKHYAAWVRERQEQAEAYVMQAWARDPLVFEAEKVEGVQ